MQGMIHPQQTSNSLDIEQIIDWYVKIIHTLNIARFKGYKERLKISRSP